MLPKTILGQKKMTIVEIDKISKGLHQLERRLFPYLEDGIDFDVRFVKVCTAVVGTVGSAV